VEKGQLWLFEPDRYFFYLTNDWTTPASEVVSLACPFTVVVPPLQGMYNRSP
jgi:hypothetical protein